MTNEPGVVLDASALLCLLNTERGHDRVAAVIQRSHMSAVNLAEVVARLAEHGLPEQVIRTAIGGLGVTIHHLDQSAAFHVGLLRPATKALGLSLGDRACLALAKHLGLAAFTADQGWSRAQIGVEVTVIR